MPAHFGLQQETVLGQVVAFQYLGDLEFQFIRTDIGEKAQAAAVNPQHRHLVPRQRAGRAEHAAVAADDDNQIADLAENLP
ncbi:hypothetical protein D3C85_309100 [compost metagenome]